MSGWTRRIYSSVGLTQCPPGPFHEKIRYQFGGGHVILCIDVSGSMSGQPLLEAVKGASRFLDEAIGAGYNVALVLWDTGVRSSSTLSTTAQDARALLAHASAGGGNDLAAVLNHCESELAGLPGDRVVAIFGDGDISPREQVLEKTSQMKADNVRFVTRGLGARAATEFALIDSEKPEAVAVDSVTDLASGIAGMSKNLRGIRTKEANPEPLR